MLSSTKLKDQLADLPFFVDTLKGYTPFKAPKKVVKYLERMQTQQNLAEDKVRGYP